MENAGEAVAAEVRAQLARHRRSGTSVAAELGWTQIYLWRRLTAKVAFDVNDLAAVAGVLGVPVTSFFPAGVGGQLPDELVNTLAVAA